MNAIQITLLRALATLLVAIPFASCSTPSSSSVPDSASTPTGALEVLPTPTLESTIAPTSDPVLLDRLLVTVQ